MSLTDHIPHHTLDSQSASLSSCPALLCGTSDLGTTPRAVHAAIPIHARIGDARVSPKLVCRGQEISGGEEGPAAAAGVGWAGGGGGESVDGVGGCECYVAFGRDVVRIWTGYVAVDLSGAVFASRGGVEV